MRIAVVHWFKQLWIALDQLLNVLITPLHPGAFADETMSSRAWRMEQAGKPWGRIMRPAIDWVALHVFRDRDHCRMSYLSEREGSQLPPEMRGPQ